MTILLLLTIYCSLIVVASLLGGALPGWFRLTHRQMQLVMSFVGGLMLGVAVLHLLPHSVAEQGSVDRAAAWTLGGLLTMFLLIRVFHVHAHEHGDAGDVLDEHRHTHDHEGPCSHEHQHQHAHGQSRGTHAFSWLGLAFGLSLHTLIDGLALGAAVAADAHEARSFALYGLATFLAVALHKPLDALSITSLMAAGGWKQSDIQLANAIFALMCPLGALAFVFGFAGLFAEQHVVVGCALAFAAGVFLCISLADLLPEVAFHTHDRVRLTLALMAGIALAWLIGFIEPGHSHQHHHDTAHQHSENGP
ncbi:MAG TPA: ZIP family metal transporter [Pirellulaceae bacterium]|nr:ZIP family metal transporter [Pirellulaceae bacterium]